MCDDIAFVSDCRHAKNPWKTKGLRFQFSLNCAARRNKGGNSQSTKKFLTLQAPFTAFLLFPAVSAALLLGGNSLGLRRRKFCHGRAHRL